LNDNFKEDLFYNDTEQSQIEENILMNNSIKEDCRLLELIKINSKKGSRLPKLKTNESYDKKKVKNNLNNKGRNSNCNSQLKPSNSIALFKLTKRVSNLKETVNTGNTNTLHHNSSRNTFLMPSTTLNTSKNKQSMRNIFNDKPSSKLKEPLLNKKTMKKKRRN